jgi:hypothetical protein
MSGEVNRDSGELKSEAQQRRERRALHLRCSMTRDEYEIYGFNRRDVDYSYMMNFLTVHDLRNHLRPALNDDAWKGVLDNKWFFQLHYSRLGMPVPESYGVYEPGAGVDLRGRPLGTAEALRRLLGEFRPPNLVIKPMGGIMGKGILILSELRYDGAAISAVTNTGRTMQFDEIAAKLDTPPNVIFHMRDYRLALPGYLLQAKVSQHPLLDKITPHTTNTLRVVTFRDRSSAAHVQCTTLRAGRTGNTADNWEQGGISIAVDRATGVLGRGVLKPKYGGKWVEIHPDTGFVFSGLQLPYWNEVLDLCSRAAQAAPGIRTVGWDIALTSDGPVLIEGNPDWDLPMVQVHTRGLLQPDVRRQLADFGLHFPEHTLPPLGFRQWRERRRDKRMSSDVPSGPRRLFQLLSDPPTLYRKIVRRLTKSQG